MKNSLKRKSNFYHTVSLNEEERRDCYKDYDKDYGDRVKQAVLEIRNTKRNIVFSVNDSLLFFNGLIKEPLKLEEEQSRKSYLVMIPGYNGWGGTYAKESGITNSDYMKCDELKNEKEVDFGQSNCIRHFLKQMSNDNVAIAESHDIIFYAISLGTSTLLHAFNSLPHSISSKVKCIVLEGVLSNCNSSIFYQFKQKYPKISYMPFSRWWLPWIVGKFLYPAYNPFAFSPLSYAQSLPINLPVIIIHGKKDDLLSINNARELYCFLYKNRKNFHNENKNIYLFEGETDKAVHLNIIHHDKAKKQKIKALQQIYKNNNLPYNQNVLSELEETFVDLTEFQPSISVVEKNIKETNKQYRFNIIIDAIATVGITGAFAYIAWLKWKKNTYLSYS